ncbi:MAG: hypothetical protein ACI4IF_02880 [Acutalibacteraceae bacterium]
MAEYSYSEIMKMQNDAIKRVEDMQKRARATAGLDESPKVTNSNNINKADAPKRVPMPNDYLDELKKRASDSHREEKTHNENNKSPKAETNSYNPFDNLKNIFQNLNIDNDKALILSLILLLTEEHADEMLIMALTYMLT